MLILFAETCLALLISWGRVYFQGLLGFLLEIMSSQIEIIYSALPGLDYLASFSCLFAQAERVAEQAEHRQDHCIQERAV